MDQGGETGPAAGPVLSVDQVVSAITRFRYLVLGCVALGFVLGALFALAKPNQYRSAGKLYVRPGIRETITPESAFSGADARAVGMPNLVDAVANEMQVLSAPQLFEKVVERLGTDMLLAPYDPSVLDNEEAPWHTRLFHAFQTWWFATAGEAEVAPTGDPEYQAARLLAETVSISREANTSVITVTYATHSPELARTVVNAVLDAAQAMHREIFDTLSSIGKIEEELKSSEEAAQIAEQALREFRVEKDIYDYAQQSDALLARLGDLDRQIDTIDVDTARRQAEAARLSVLLQEVPFERDAVESGDDPRNTAFTDLVNHKRALELRSLDLDAAFQAGSLSLSNYTTQRERLTKLIEAVDAELQAAMQNLKPRREENPRHSRIAETLDEVDVALKGLTETRANLELSRKDLRKKLAEFEALTPALRRLEHDAAKKRAEADRLAVGVADMKMIQRADQLNLSNVQVMHGGTLERVKVGPRRGQQVILGGMLGGALGAALALLLALRDPTVRDRKTLVGLMPADSVLQSQPAAEGTTATPADPLAEARHDIAHFWASIAYDRRAKDCLKIAFVPCGGADGNRAAAAMAIGLALHGGEQVAFVQCSAGPGWLGKCLGLPNRPGWTDVLRGGASLEQALASTSVPGLHHLPLGDAADAVPHPMTGPAFVALLDRVAANHRFVIVELPDIETTPEVRSVLGVMDAAELVVRERTSTKAEVRATSAAVNTVGARLLGAVVQPPAGDPDGPDAS